MQKKNSDCKVSRYDFQVALRKGNAACDRRILNKHAATNMLDPLQILA